MDIRESDFSASATGLESVNALADLARERLREREKTRRLLIFVASVAFMVGALIITFAPADKQQVAYVIGAVLMIFALGAIGSSQFTLKMLGVEVSAKDERLLREIATRPEISEQSYIKKPYTTGLDKLEKSYNPPTVHEG
ncbi:MAG: hypothetical protein ACKO8M_05465 [Microcystis panniformis]